QYANTAT
ncbi:unnamed protein product, partial [Callosobruchus maculatus]